MDLCAGRLGEEIVNHRDSRGASISTIADWSSRDKVVTGWTARTLAPMRSIEFAWLAPSVAPSKEHTNAIREA